MPDPTPARRRSATRAEEEASLYDLRFVEGERSAKDAIWREIGRFLQRRYIDPDGRVMDVASDLGYFIRNIRAAERWASDLRDTSASMPPDVRFVQSDGLALADAAPNDYFDVVFMSNYLEHLDSAESVIEQLRVAYRLLRPGGHVIVLQPNIKLVGDAYWDFIDHRVPLTDESLQEAAAFAGFSHRQLIRRFLPYSTKSGLPSHPLLVRGYLAFPPAWWLLGKQTLYVGERKQDTAPTSTPT
jgi:SAM-dependent methyltransferase